MKTFLKFTALSAVLLMLATGLVSCDRSSSETPPETPNVTEFTWEILPMTELEDLEGSHWKLVGIVDAVTGSLKELSPKDCEKCYRIIFDNNTIGNNENGYTFFLFTSINTLRGHYMVDLETRRIMVSNFGGTRARETDDGDLFYDAFSRVQALLLQENELRLFYNNKQSYLLFKSIEP